MNVPLFSCASPRLNLAVSKILAPYEHLLADVYALMVESRLENNMVEMKKYTDLQPFKRNTTH